MQAYNIADIHIYTYTQIKPL